MAEKRKTQAVKSEREGQSPFLRGKRFTKKDRRFSGNLKRRMSNYDGQGSSPLVEIVPDQLVYNMWRSEKMREICDTEGWLGMGLRPYSRMSFRT